MKQLCLWDDRPPYPRPNRSKLPFPTFPCPGCGAKPEAWTYANRGDDWVAWLVSELDSPVFRAQIVAEYDLCLGGSECTCDPQFHGHPSDLSELEIGELAHYVAVCDECADCAEVMFELLMADPPAAAGVPAWADPVSPWGGGDDRKIDLMHARHEDGFSVFHRADATAPVWKKNPMGPPEKHHADGETGVERCGDRWRARPFFRGRKWFWGLYDTEEKAISVVREFWKIHKADDRPKPALWLPCEKLDGEFGAVAVEWEHLHLWECQYPGANAKKIARKFRGELKRARTKPAAVEVFCELERRLAAASGPVIFTGYDWSSGQTLEPEPEPDPEPKGESHESSYRVPCGGVGSYVSDDGRPNPLCC